MIGSGPGDGDPSAVASSWTSRRSTRPRAVVLIETLRAVDRLRAVAAGVDAVFPAERMVEELPALRPHPRPDRPAAVDRAAGRRRRGSRRPASPPSGGGQHPGRALSAGQGRFRSCWTARCPTCWPLAPRLATRTVSRSCSPGAAGPALPPAADRHRRGRIRPSRSRRFAPAPTTSCPTPRRPELLLQTVITRAERGRRLREMLHRDELTGLLNHGALMAELEYAVEYGRRHGGAARLRALRARPASAKCTSGFGQSWATRSCSTSPTSSAPTCAPAT